MTPNEILFSQITDNLYAYKRLQTAIDAEQAKPGPHFSAGLHHASGTLLEERRFLMAAYSQSDMVIFRCPLHGLFWLSIDDACHISVGCEGDAGYPIERLLADGTWQSEVERQQENLRQYEKA